MTGADDSSPLFAPTLKHLRTVLNGFKNWEGLFRNLAEHGMLTIYYNYTKPKNTGQYRSKRMKHKHAKKRGKDVRQSVPLGSTTIMNWELFVCGPELAMLITPY